MDCFRGAAVFVASFFLGGRGGENLTTDDTDLHG